MPRIQEQPPRLRTLDTRRLKPAYARLDPIPGPFANLYRSPEWRALMRRLIAERGRRCEKCGAEHRPDGQSVWLVGDHIVELEDGGAPLDPGNVRLLCQLCHMRKTAGAKAQRDPAAMTPRANPHPEWLRPSTIPLHIVCGPPSAGKSTLVRQWATPHDLVIDLDDIACRLAKHGFTKCWARDQWLGPALRARNDLLGKLSRRQLQWSQAWFIVSEPSPDKRQWWADKMRPASINVLMVDQATCAQRIAQDAALGADAGIKGEHMAALSAWFRQYAPSPVDRVIRPQAGVPMPPPKGAPQQGPGPTAPAHAQPVFA